MTYLPQAQREAFEAWSLALEDEKIVAVSHDGEKTSRSRLYVRTTARKLVVKIGRSEKARIEQAGNFYLGKKLPFIVPADKREPFFRDGFYVTEQRDVRGESNRDDKYYVAALAELHAQGLLVPELARSLKPSHKLRAWDFLYPSIASSSRFPLNLARLAEMRTAYEETVAELKEPKAVLHGDPKQQHRLGSFWLDLEDLCLGDEAFDLAFVLNDPKNPLNHEEGSRLIDVYTEASERLGKRFTIEFQDRVRRAQLVRAIISIEWNLRNFEQNPSVSSEKLAHLTQMLGLEK